MWCSFCLKFYNDLTPILLKFQSKVNDFVFARKTEKEDLMKEIQTNLTRPSSGANLSNSAKPNRPPPPAPVYQPATTPDSNAGGGNAPVYPQNPYYPTMPNAYNPYQFYQQPGQQQPQQPGGYPPYYPPYPPQ
jgi:programmed cell death 6-interacting protein